MEELPESESDPIICSYCKKKYSNGYSLKKHFGTCKLYLASVSTIPLRNPSAKTIYNVDKTLDKYLDTCDNEYAKFKCCENEHYPVCIPNFWPCLFDYRSKEEIEDIKEDLCSHKSYEVLNLILQAAHHYYNIRSISFSLQASIMKDGKVYNISSYRTPHHWQNIVNRKRPTFQVDIHGGMISISFSEKYYSQLHDPLYLKCVSLLVPVLKDGDDISSDESSVQELSQTFSQVSLEEDCVENPSKRSRFDIELVNEETDDFEMEVIDDTEVGVMDVTLQSRLFHHQKI